MSTRVPTCDVALPARHTFAPAHGADAPARSRAPFCSIYERGLAYCSTDYNSHALWDKYFAFETEQASSLHTASLFSRVLTCPIKELDRYYMRWEARARAMHA